MKLKLDLICRIGKALHEYGTSAHRLEAILNHLSKILGLKGNFFSTPTYLAVSIDFINENGEFEQFTRHLRVNPGETNLFKMQLIDELANSIADSEISIKEAIAKIDEIKKQSNPYNNFIILLAFSVTSLSLALIFKGGFLETALSFVFGIIVGALAIASSYSEKIKQIFELFSSFLVTFISYSYFHLSTDFDYQIVLISSLIVIIPGLNLTIAMNELATHNLVSGTARLMGTLMTFFKIAFGILLGVQIGNLIFGKLHLVEATPIAYPWTIIPIFLACLSFTVIFTARMSDFKWILIGGFLTLGSLTFSSVYLPQTLSIFLSAFLIGSFSNLLAKFRNKPAALTLLPGIIFIVPGSVGLKGINHIFQQNYLAGIDGGLNAVVLSITIVAGLFFANTVITPRKTL